MARLAKRTRAVVQLFFGGETADPPRIAEKVLANRIARRTEDRPLRNNTHPTTYALFAKGVRELPDMLAAAQLSLRPLAKGETAPSSAEGRRMVGDAYDLLRDALANLAEVTRNLPELPLEGRAGESSGNGNPNGHGPADPRMSPRSHDDGFELRRPLEQCALTQRIGGPAGPTPRVTTRLTLEQLDRLRRCANGNTLRFESSDIVEALVSGGYATEGAGRVVTVTPKGHRYLLSHPG